MSRVRGNAVWTDLEARTHTIGLPSDDAHGLGVGFRSDYPWIPVTGIWSARVTGQDRNVRTFDAADIVILWGGRRAPLRQLAIDHQRGRLGESGFGRDQSESLINPARYRIPLSMPRSTPTSLHLS